MRPPRRHDPMQRSGSRRSCCGWRAERTRRGAPPRPRTAARLRRGGPVRHRSDGAPRRDRAMVVVAILTACAVLGPAAFWFFGRDDKVPAYGPSMLPTLDGAEPLDIDFKAYDRGRPRLEDIVALQGPHEAATLECAAPRDGSPCTMPAGDYGGEFLIKRIVAGPGDTIAIGEDG